jgi:hypothetical protein
MELDRHDAHDEQSMLETIVVPRTHDLGGGFEVRRALPHRDRRMVGPFVFLDQMGPTSSTPAPASTSVRTRTSACPPSPICWRARFRTATASARCRTSVPAPSTG